MNSSNGSSVRIDAPAPMKDEIMARFRSARLEHF
jgi:hypothetical protein